MDSFSLVIAPIEAELQEFKTLFSNSLPTSNPLLESVVEHIRRKNGKMMRPVLVLLTARLYGEACHTTLEGALSLELLHTASLVHDDVVDESEERRGQPSVNAAFNNKVAVLSGDFLLATSLVHAEQTANLHIIKVISELGQNLAAGELLQLSNVSNSDFSEKVYFDVIRKKTAALFAACTEVGALSVGVGEEQLALVRQLGEYIGICFQIKDDIFDYFDNREIGKPTGNDMLEGKLTLPALYALNSTRDAHAANIATRVKERKATSEEIARLIAFAKENGGIEYALQVIDRYKQEACKLIDTMPPSDVRTALYAYLDAVVNRVK